MPPVQLPPIIEPDHQLAQPKKAPAGPIVGTIIIVILMLFGALYFWGQRLNARDQYENLPIIPAEGAGTAQ